MTPLRFYQLARMSKSPAHYRAAVEAEPTEAMETGLAADSLLLGGRPVLAYPGAQRRGKDYEAFVAANPGALIVTKTEAERALGIAEAVHRCEDAVRLLEGVRQETLYWEFQGRACRGTPDVRGADYLTDLKTGETSDPRFFGFKVKRYAYHAQLAWYESGCGLLGYDIRESYIVAVEQTPPHVVTVYRVTPQIIELGARLWRLWFEQLQVCEASGAFPGYAQSIVDLDFPADDDLALSDAGEVVSTTA